VTEHVHKYLKDRDAIEAMEFLETSAMLQKQTRYLGLECRPRDPMQRWMSQECFNIYMLPFVVEHGIPRGAPRETDALAFLRVVGASTSLDLN
jgi:hypothetical protein